jgi:arginase
MLALRRRGRYGLLFLDGHADFYQPEAEPAGEAASMDLALVTGHGPAILTDLEGRSPLVGEDDVVAIGRRDAAETEKHGSQRIEESTIDVIDLAALRKLGAEAVSARAMQRLAGRDLEGFWIHLDADVLDDAIMPAVDYRMAGGLSRDELTTILRASMASDRAVGIQLTILNPKLDRDGTATRTFVDVVADGLS